MGILMQMCRLNDKNDNRGENVDEDDDAHLLLDPVLDPTETALLFLSNFPIIWTLHSA